MTLFVLITAIISFLVPSLILRGTMSHSPNRSITSIFIEPTSKVYPQFLLFGDSITQGASHVLHSSLSEWYQRKIDVINRGFSGYTAPAGYDTLIQFFPTHAPSTIIPHIQLMTVFFGANDACVPGHPQHVPIGEYKQNLRNIIEHEGVKLHETKVILVVPTPVDEWQLGNQDRTATITARYADACREVGKEFDLPILDLWTIFMNKAGWNNGQQGPLIGSRAAPKSEVFEALLIDGLHFTPEGYKLVFDELVNVIRNDLPDLVPERLPQIFPDWRFKLGLVEQQGVRVVL